MQWWTKTVIVKLRPEDQGAPLYNSSREGRICRNSAVGTGRSPLHNTRHVLPSTVFGRRGWLCVVQA